MTDITPQKSSKAVHASGDYKSVDPTPVTLKKGAADGLEITVTPTLLSGSGCTVTVTVTDADTGRTIGTPLVVSSAVASLLKVTIPKETHRVTVTPVGSGTRTTLTYSVSAVWSNLTYSHSPYHDGTAWVSSEAVNP